MSDDRVRLATEAAQHFISDHLRARDCAIAVLDAVETRMTDQDDLSLGDVSRSAADLGSCGQQSGWRPIETAPKDGYGNNIFLLVDWEPLFVVGFYGIDPQNPRSEATCVAWDHSAIRDGYDEPTHWMPPPEPPQEKGS